jgi:hypothetical protein
VPIAFETGAGATVAELVSAGQRNLSALRSRLPTLQGIGTDERTGELVLTVFATGREAEAAKSRAAEMKTLLGVPSRIDVVNSPIENSDVRGGASLSSCTSGFVVKNSAGTTGVVTAAHCSNSLTYYNPNGTSIALSYVSGAFDSDQDIQWHTSAYVERPEFYADSGTTARLLTGRRYRSSTAAGNNVCHRGISTGYSCGYVQQTNYRPTFDGACGTDVCDPVYVTVTGPDLACFPGDSGGPIFASQTAFGLDKAGTRNGTARGQCGLLVYMSTDSLLSGLSLLYG